MVIRIIEEYEIYIVIQLDHTDNLCLSRSLKIAVRIVF